MDNILEKLERVYQQMETDRTTAIEEYESIKGDTVNIDPKFRARSREVGGQLLKLAADISISQAKILTDLVKQSDQGLAVDTGRKELLASMEDIDLSILRDEMAVSEATATAELVNQSEGK